MVMKRPEHTVTDNGCRNQVEPGGEPLLNQGLPFGVSQVARRIGAPRWGAPSPDLRLWTGCRR